MHDCVCELVHIILMRLVLNPDWDSALQLQNVDLVPGGHLVLRHSVDVLHLPRKKQQQPVSLNIIIYTYVICHIKKHKL